MDADERILVLAVFILVAAIFQMHTILFLAMNAVTVMATAQLLFSSRNFVELWKSWEKKVYFLLWFRLIRQGDRVRFSEDTITSIVEASYSMGSVKTGALIVVEQAIRLTEYESTGIHLDCLISKQVLEQIFEHNTPLHDGAIIVRGDRIVSATCYLPLSDNMELSKDLGTRHRAAVGMSEVSDAVIIVVSEETGAVSVAHSGKLLRDITREELKSESGTDPEPQGGVR